MLNDEYIREQIKEIMGRSYEKVGITEEEIVKYFKKTYEEIQKEDLDEKSKELLFRVVLSNSDSMINFIKNNKNKIID